MRAESGELGLKHSAAEQAAIEGLLERAVADRVEELVNADWGGLRTDPAWDDLQDEPRFQALLKQVGLDVWPKCITSSGQKD